MQLHRTQDILVFTSGNKLIFGKRCLPVFHSKFLFSFPHLAFRSKQNPAESKQKEKLGFTSWEEISLYILFEFYRNSSLFLLIYVLISSSVYVDFTLYLFNTLFRIQYLFLKIFQLWPLVIISAWVSCPFDMPILLLFEKLSYFLVLCLCIEELWFFFVCFLEKQLWSSGYFFLFCLKTCKICS